MLTLRPPQSIYQAHGRISNGTFNGRWHFSFDRYHDPAHVHFNSLRVFNDDTLSPGATWPLHPHVDNEVVTYIAAGVFRHEDEHGKGGILRQGWVQHTTVGTGMWHSEINESNQQPMRFIQMWFIPSKRGLPPAVQQRPAEKIDRQGRFLALVSDDGASHPDALPIVSAAAVYSCFLPAGEEATRPLRDDYDGYLYVLEGGPVEVEAPSGSVTAPALAAVEVRDELSFTVRATADTELLLVETARMPQGGTR